MGKGQGTRTSWSDCVCPIVFVVRLHVRKTDLEGRVDVAVDVRGAGAADREFLPLQRPPQRDGVDLAPVLGVPPADDHPGCVLFWQCVYVWWVV